MALSVVAEYRLVVRKTNFYYMATVRSTARLNSIGNSNKILVKPCKMTAETAEGIWC